MALPHVASSVHSCRRQLRLLWRHLRFGHAHFTASGRAARHAALAEVFHGTNTFLRALGVPYWLDFGTLLGWHREGGIIPHDYDVDFGAPVDAYPQVLAARARLPRGFRLFDTSPRHLGPKLYVVSRGWEADIYFYRPDGSLYHPLARSAHPSERRPFPRAWIEPVQPATFLGAATFVPAQPETYLRHYYGYLGPDAVRDSATGLFRPRLAPAPLPSVSDRSPL